MVAHASSSAGEMDGFAAQKLRAFERIEAEFRESFLFVGDVHGQRRFDAFPVGFSVRYLHALWVCECKDRLLNVPASMGRFEGRRSLELLRGWQRGETANVVAFLQHKLDSMPFAELTRQVDEAERTADPPLARRLAHGRRALLNRSFNLLHALDAIFALSREELVRQVRKECARYGHTQKAIARQLAELAAPLYTPMRHPALARQNMRTMMGLGVAISDNSADRPGNRTERAALPSSPIPAYAEVPIVGELTLASMLYNNPGHLDLAMPPLLVDAPELFARQTSEADG